MEEDFREHVYLGYLINFIMAIGLVLIVMKSMDPGAGQPPPPPPPRQVVEAAAAESDAAMPAPAETSAATSTALAGTEPTGGNATAQSVAAMAAFGPTAPTHALAAINKGGCAGCHLIPGVPGANGKIGPNLSAIGVDGATRIEGYSAAQYITESIIDPNAFIAPTCPNGACPPGVMLQSFAQTLSADDLTAIVDYLALLGTGNEATVMVEAGAPVALSRALPAESVLEPFAELPKAPAKEAQIALGKYLFFDQRLSGNNSLSCASCHQPDNAFTDGQALSAGYPSTNYFRNTPTVMNTAYAGYLYRDGRMDGGDMPTLVRDHLTEAHFMSMDGRLMWERLNQVPPYVDLFNEVYGSGPSFGGVLNAITAYVQTLNSPPAPYDQYVAGDTSALSADAIAGLALFEGKANCVACHSGALLSDDDFYNIGVGTDPALFADPERHLTFRRFFRILGTPNYRNLNEDVGLYALTLDEADRGKFRTPSLREVGRTAPHMHDGSLATLDDVVQFYNAGGGATQTANLQPLDLSEAEVGQLVAFLESLSSEVISVEVPQLPNYGLVAIGDAAGPPATVFVASALVEAVAAPADAAATTTLTETTAVEPPSNDADTSADTGTTDEFDIEAITAIVVKATCNACHTISTIPGALGIVGPKLDNIGAAAAERIPGYTAEQYIHESLVDPNAFVAPQCPFGSCVPGSMPANLADILSEEEISLLVNYLLSLKGGE